MVVPMDAPWREYPKVVVELAAQPAFLADRTRIMVAIKHAALLLIWQSPPKANSSPAHFVQLRVMAGSGPAGGERCATIKRNGRHAQNFSLLRKYLQTRVKTGGASIVLKRSEEHTSELQSPCNLVCRLLLQKKKYQSQEATAEPSES